MLNMIEWWICLNMPPDEVNKIARFPNSMMLKKR